MKVIVPFSVMFLFLLCYYTSRFCASTGAIPATHFAALHPARQKAVNPGPRGVPSLIYAEHLRRVLLLDGYYPAIQPEFSQVWGWDGERWDLLPGSGPPARYVSSAVYDSRRKRVVIFGGRVGKKEEIKGDTWEWDGIKWRETPDNSVGPRDHHAMTFDRRAGVVLLYGGSVDGSRIIYDDMWQWDGKRWTEIRLTGPTPGKRAIHVMAYDTARAKTVLYGGTRESVMDDTWEWDGQRWRQVNQ